jgi:hypothetical protein
MTPRAKRGVFALSAVGALAIGTAGYAWQKSRRPEPLPPPHARADALDAIPNDAGLLATIDLAALRSSPLASLVSGPRSAAWLGGVKATCGFEPLEMLSEIALTAPSGSADGDFGIVGAGAVDQAALIDCATKVIRARGGNPVASTLGSFKTVRDVAATPGAAGGEIAARSGGPLLIGSGEMMRSMVDTADGALPSVKTNASQVALRTAIAEGALAEISVVLSARQRTAVAEEVDRANGKAPAALKGVVAAALGARVSSETVQLHAVVLAADDAQAKDLADALDALRKQRAENSLLQHLGIAALIGRVRVTCEGNEVHARLELTIEEAKQYVDGLAAPAASASASP